MKEKVKENVLISVITVVYQAEKEILYTLESVRNQTSTSFEYIIIDGKSKDSTVSVIEEFLIHFKEKNISVIFSSEKDKGIYDAMNKAVLRASGNWLLFMNAGDTFYETTTLQQLEGILRVEQCDVIHGSQCWNEPGNVYIVESNDSENLPDGQVLFHQSSLVKREVLINNPFSLEYKIAGDYEFFLRLQQKGYSFHKIPNIIANFAYGGVSSTHPIVCLKEKTKIRKKYGCIKEKKIVFVKWYLGEYIIAVIKTILPRSVDLKIVEWKKNIFNYIIKK